MPSSSLKNGESDSIKELILQKERQLVDEKSPMMRGKLIKEIAELAAQYSQYEPCREVSLKKKTWECTGENTSMFSGSTEKKVIKGIQESKVDGFRCSEAFISSAHKIETGLIESTGSILLESVTNSKIRCASQQLRLINCHDVVLEAYTSTGIFLQSSSNIVIVSLAYSGLSENRYHNVKDFTSPGSTKNYKIICTDENGDI